MKKSHTKMDKDPAYNINRFLAGKLTIGIVKHVKGQGIFMVDIVENDSLSTKVVSTSFDVKNSQWFKPGDFVLVEKYEKISSNVVGEIVDILDKKATKEMKKSPMWPDLLKIKEENPTWWSSGYQSDSYDD